MNTARVIFHLALADFYERTRRYSFLLTLAAIIGLGVLVNNGFAYFYLTPGNLTRGSLMYRGEFNSAWTGTMIALVANMVLFLLGFYLVSDCIQRDIRTGVGQIIATTTVRRATYLAGKWISNFAVLSLLVLILAAAAAVMVLLKGEARLDPGALLMPFLAVALPRMAMVAALAVLFESVPWLRGVLGNVVYFFLWISVTGASSMGGMELPLLKDPLGERVFRSSLFAAARSAFPGDTISNVGLQLGPAGQFRYKIFPWSGLDWTPGIVAGQWLWAVLGLGLILLAALWFARFDPSREGLRHRRVKVAEADNGEPVVPTKKAPRITLPSLSPLISRLAGGSPFLGALLAELRLLLKGRRWWWWLIIIGLNVAILLVPYEIAKQYLLPVAWLWPIAIWSGMGNRERRNNTAQMVFSSSRPVLRQLPAAWLAGVLATTLLTIAGAAVLQANSDLTGLLGWAGAVLFVPTLAMALGVLSSAPRVFEVVYVVWWYMGPLQKTQGVDFTNGAPLVYLLAAAGLLMISAYWRGKQVRV
jgi:ABC-type transport system involved in multi-copper enzyme maturation permease subunit